MLQGACYLVATYAIYREPVPRLGPNIYRNTMVFAQDDSGNVAVRAIDGAKEAEWSRRLAGGELTYFDGGAWGLRRVGVGDPDFFRALAVLLRYGKAHLSRPCPLDGVDAETAVDDVFKHQIGPGHFWRVRSDGEAELMLSAEC